MKGIDGTGKKEMMVDIGRMIRCNHGRKPKLK